MTDVPQDNLPANIEEAEARIRHQSFETAFIFDQRSGACLIMRDGGESEVSLNYAIAQVAGNIVLHNHPLGRNISEDDMRFIARAKPSEFRIVTPTRRLRWVRPDMGWPDKLMEVYQNHFGIVRYRLHREVERGKLKQDEFIRRVYEQANRRTVTELVLPYTEEELESA